MRRRRQRSARREASALDVTAFLSLMVMLVPFMLITAVFSRMTILELQSAAGNAGDTALSDPLQLQIIVREHDIEIYHRGQKTARRITRDSGEQALDLLAGAMDELKVRFPQSREATILLEPQVPYDDVVQVMDVVRMQPPQGNDTVPRRERFPLIALGEIAPLRRGALAQ
jgi:biopolymer transport protein ExbD